MQVNIYLETSKLIGNDGILLGRHCITLDEKDSVSKLTGWLSSLKGDIKPKTITITLKS